MIARLIDLSVRFRWLVLFIFAGIAALGVYNLLRLPIDAVPDITNKQVQITAVAPALGPTEMEGRVSFPIETALAGIPGLETTRSLSRNGFSQVTAVFEESVDLYFARQQVAERLARARETMPEGVEPTMGPISTGLGEVVMWTVRFADRRVAAASNRPGFQRDGSYLTPEGERLATPVQQASYLRTVQDWIVAPQVRGVANIAGVDAIGGYEKQYVVAPDPARMSAYGVSFSELADALEAGNRTVGANFVERAGEAYLVRADVRFRGVPDIREAVVTTREGVPVRVADVADVQLGGGLRTGAATENGREVVVGTALMLVGQNSRTVATDVVAKLDEVRRAMPPGVQLEVVLDRSRLVNATIGTVQTNLIEGALLVVAVLFLLLGNIRAAIITAAVIPLSFLMMAIGMRQLGVSGNLMSLGALDFGLIVDGAVIIVENYLRRMGERQHALGRTLDLPGRLAEVSDSVKEMIRPSLYGQAIILLVFLPLLTFEGVEGKMFSPMAITVMLALAGAFVASLTLVPALIAIIIRGPVAEKEVRVIAAAKRGYTPTLARALAKPLPTIGVGVAMFAASLLVFGTLGREFIPQLDEGDAAILSARVPSVSLEQSVEMQKQVERVVTSFPQVIRMFSKTGTAEVATDPMPVNISDGFVLLKPRDEWPDPTLTKAQLIEQMEEKLGGLLGNNFEISQPIELRFNELIAGVRSDVALSVYGDDLDAMGRTATRAAAVLRDIEGATDVRVEQTAGFPTLDVQFDRGAIAANGLTVAQVSDTVAAALGGREAGLVFEGDRRFDVVVRLPDAFRDDLDALAALPVTLEGAGREASASVPLGSVATFGFTEGLNQVSREDGKRRVVVQMNVRGRDLGSFVAEAQARIAAEASPPPGSWYAWGGEFENLAAAQARLGLVVPLCVVLIFALLFLAVGDWALALAIFSAIPMALAGGIFSLALFGLDFSISAAVGLIALSGVAVLNGLVMVTAIQKRLEDGLPAREAILDGALERVRPVLMTALVASLGFVPMALASGVGAEVQKPLAIVVIGGLITATVLTLFVLPAILLLVLQRRRDRIAPSRADPRLGGAQLVSAQ